ncbi:MazG-like nucleotide pyrophosphohydrolase [Gordonia phage Marietta]|uniref:MazG-like nucleotide pyrophosphohydrolase n=1 Tax=Gordonia phage Marietta TaxID=2301558 RepID=A0A385DRY8_9CAUD|nr:pyrophosphatase [Gordonia phage Marietta]AXQ61339.1 MazG-like nucleotide pyrophosphohydrolase [Gordonia phage Marietta]QAU06346.1 MazG-like nucleotide pyrophosphohydrolase [Gordonia phage WhoseManz]
MTDILDTPDLVQALEGVPPRSLMDDGGVLTPAGERLIEMGLKALVLCAHLQAEKAGWNENRNTVIEELALVTTEVAEAIEEARDGCPGVYGLYYDTETQKPEGIASEIGDVIIRSAHLSTNPQHGSIDVVEGTLAKLRYNPTRGHRHGGRLA